jgi:hypothetical protein
MAYTVKRALFTAEQKSCIQTILTKVLVSTAELIFGRIDEVFLLRERRQPATVSPFQVNRENYFYFFEKFSTGVSSIFGRFSEYFY